MTQIGTPMPPQPQMAVVAPTHHHHSPQQSQFQAQQQNSPRDSNSGSSPKSAASDLGNHSFQQQLEPTNQVEEWVKEQVRNLVRARFPDFANAEPFISCSWNEKLI